MSWQSLGTTSLRIADRCGVKFVGCASHRLNLAVSAYLERHDPLLENVNTLMGKLKSTNLAGPLREHTSLKTLQRNNSLVGNHGHDWEVYSTEAIPGVSKQRSETCSHASHTERKQRPWQPSGKTANIEICHCCSTGRKRGSRRCESSFWRTFIDISRTWICRIFTPRCRNRTLKIFRKCNRQTIV